MDVVLVAGLWLDGSAWEAVLPGLERRGHHGVAVTLPGQGDGAREASYDDQAAAVIAAVDACPGSASSEGPAAGERPVLVVGHSAACTLAWAAADARPDRVAGVVLIGGFPRADGDRYADFFEPRDGAVPFPGWEPFAGPDIADLDEETREAVARRTVPVPAAVTQGVVRLRDERRYDTPVTLLCPEFTPEEAREWLSAGEMPELERTRDLQLVDLDTGHWPMFSRPELLAETIAGIVDRLAVSP